jgi:hypothetical protein
MSDAWETDAGFLMLDTRSSFARTLSSVENPESSISHE